MNYGHLPREFGIDQVEECSIPDLTTWLHEREVMLQHLQQQFKHAQDRMKKQADKHRTNREFEVGDMVFLKLQPFIQTLIAQRPYQKLAFRYYGLYCVEARVGAVAYKLKLPEGAKIHPVVHVSQLKRAIGADVSISAQLPPANHILQAKHQPEAILDSKNIQVQGKSASRVLVLWCNLPSSLPTWEDPARLQ